MYSEKTKEARKRACKAYYMRNKPYIKAFVLRLDKRRDADVIEVLDSVANKTEFIRQLVRKYGGER